MKKNLSSVANVINIRWKGKMRKKMKNHRSQNPGGANFFPYTTFFYLNRKEESYGIQPN